MHAGIVVELHQSALRASGVLEHVVGDLVDRPFECRQTASREFGRRGQHRVDDSIDDLVLFVRGRKPARGHHGSRLPAGGSEPVGRDDVSPVRVGKQAAQFAIIGPDQEEFHVRFVVETHTAGQDGEHRPRVGPGRVGKIQRDLAEALVGHRLVYGREEPPE